MNATTMKKMTKMKNLDEAASSSKRLEKQTHGNITEDRVASGYFTAMVIVAKITYIAKLTVCKCTRDCFSKNEFEIEIKF